MKKESSRRHHYLPRSYLKRFAQGKKHRLHVEEVTKSKTMRVFSPNISSFLVECGIYDLSSYKNFSPSFDQTEDGLVEDLLFAQIYEPLYNKSLEQSVDLNFCPDLQMCKGIIAGVWTMYLRTPRVRKANAQILKEIDSKIDVNRRAFMENFGMVTAKTILKLFPKVFLHTRSILFNAVGEARFLTTDNPASPCIYDLINEQVIRCDEYKLQQSVILGDEWPAEVGLLCVLSPQWCLWTQSVQNISSVEYVIFDSFRTRHLNQFIRGSADRFVILPPSKPS